MRWRKSTTGSEALYKCDRATEIAGQLWGPCSRYMDAATFAAILVGGPQDDPDFPPTLNSEIEDGRQSIEQLFLDKWQRPPRPKEWQAMVGFVLVQDGADGKAYYPPPRVSHNTPQEYSQWYEIAAERSDPFKLFGMISCQKLILEYWTSILCEVLTPSQYREALENNRVFWGRSDEEIVFPDSYVYEVRARIENAYLERLDRKPVLREWRCLFDRAGIIFTLPDGTDIEYEQISKIVNTLKMECAVELWNQHDVELSRFRFVDLLADGPTPGNSVCLSVAMIEKITEAREKIERNTELVRPLAREDWRAIWARPIRQAVGWWCRYKLQNFLSPPFRTACGFPTIRMGGSDSASYLRI